MAIWNLDELLRAIKAQQQSSCWLLYSADEYLLDAAAQRVVCHMTGPEGEQPTVLAGPVPEIQRAVEAAGAITLLGDKRVVLFSHMEPTAMAADDIKLLAELCPQLESAVLVFTVLVKEAPAKYGKPASIKLPAAAKPLLTAVEKYGVVAALEKPNEAAARRQVVQYCEQLGAHMEEDAARLLVERCKIDLYLLRAECEKLAAAAGYGTVNRQLVQHMATRSIEADVFELSRLILAGKAGMAFHLLDELLYLQQEPLMIAAALASTYLDMYQLLCGRQAHLSVEEIAEQLYGKGKEYRLKKLSREVSGRTAAQLAGCLQILGDLDRRLKGSTMEREDQLRLAVGQLLLCNRRGQYAD